MKENVLQLVKDAAQHWTRPTIPAQIPQGDMPGDSVQINDTHVAKCDVLFPALLPYLQQAMEANPYGRAVVSVCGGSGVGKSETASLLTYYLNQLGVGSYTMSGDNYPRRIPKYNDAERLQIFHYAAVRGLVNSGLYTSEITRTLKTLQEQEQDADPALMNQYPWLEIYQREGRKALSCYLGTDLEQNFAEVTEILSQFRNGAYNIDLKRMGRTETELYYEAVDFSKTHVLILEWTHGNNPGFQGVDIPILLNSTPEETRAHRRARNRDGKTDSPFTTMVLELEQKLLESQADRAKLILSKSGELLSYAAYRQLMANA